MATAPETESPYKRSPSAAPNYSICVIKLVPNEEASNRAGGEILEWFTDLNNAANFAKTKAETEVGERFAIFDCAQVWGAVNRVEQIYARRV